MIASTRAACLTPPAVGGIAVIQVAGDQAGAVLSPHLRRGGKPVDPTQFEPDELALCRIIEGDEVLDDVVVCSRRLPCGTPVVDLSLHGGPRIVQRALLLLQREGVRIVGAAELAGDTLPARTRLHADAWQVLLRAKTRQMATWLARLPDLLTARIEHILDCERQGNIADARDELGWLLKAAAQVRLIIEGPRVVLLGAANSGKSTLANVLSEQHQAIVSDLPGTTRDWTEHPAAIAGVPLTIVDTAGVRDTDDPIEQEAIARTLQQAERADVILHLVDGSIPGATGVLPASAGDRPGATGGLPAGAGDRLGATGGLPASAGDERCGSTPSILVYTKADLAHTPSRSGGLYVSAVTGAGMPELRTRILAALDLPAGGDWPVGPFTARQVEACHRAGESLQSAPHDRTTATQALQNLLKHC